MTEDGQSITIAEWLSTRAPAAPAPLYNRLLEITAGAQCNRAELSGLLVEMAAGIFRKLDDSRDSALELLAADALITYAMEAAADIGAREAARGAILSVASVVSR
jgi:predicted exporter